SRCAPNADRAEGDVSSPADFERRLTDWLDDQAPMREPEGLTYAVLARARRTRRMPGWLGHERWLPMTIALRPAAVIPRAFAYLALLALLVALMTSGFLLAGSSPSLPAVPGVANGLIALANNGDIDVV